MIVKTLSENTSLSDELGHEHGLSLYIETIDHKILFDTGASRLFSDNGAKMGVDIGNVDIAVISHGHYDHGGGLERFMELNVIAPIYINERAFTGHYAFRNEGVKTDIGLEGKLLDSGRFMMVGDLLSINENMELFSAVDGDRLRPSGNKHLLMEKDGELMPDDFLHEQNLVVREKGTTVLVAGCAHNGIVNILDRFHSLYGYWPDHIIGGFHLQRGSTAISEEPEMVKAIGKFLRETGSICHTCHCTGLEPYRVLKETMGEQIDYLSSGSCIYI